MKENIHPATREITITCTCGHALKTVSTLESDITIEICSKCHPYFSGQKRFIDSAGKVEKFQKKYANLSVGGKKKSTTH